MTQPASMHPGLALRRRIALALRRSRHCQDSGQHQSGVQAAEEALLLCELPQHRTQWQQAMVQLALHQFRMGHFADAVRSGLEVAATLDFAADAAQRAEVLCVVAIACNEMGLMQDGLKYALEALAAARTSNDTAQMINALNRAGVCTYGALGDREQGEQLLRQAAEQARLADLPVLLFAARNNLGTLYSSEGRKQLKLGKQAEARHLLQSALQHYHDAWQSVAHAGNRHQWAMLQTNLAEAYVDLGEFDHARAALAELRQALAGSDFHSLQRNADLIEATLLQRSGRVAEAVAALQQMLALPGNMIEFDMRHFAQEELYRLYKESGQFELALAQLEAIRHSEHEQNEQRSSTQGWAIRKELEITSVQLAAERERLQAERERLRAAQLEAEKVVTEARMSELEQAVLIDPLTGVGNRRCLDQQGPARLAALGQQLHGMAVVVVDLDHFKSINDRFGHAVGDEVLKKVSQIMVLRTRGSDLTVRFGGEEFVLLLMEQSLESALACCERLRLAILDYSWHEVHPLLHVTASFGVHWCHAPQPWAHALRQADLALYQAKRYGRNRLQLASLD
ncbi:MAG: diguanylate cyclase [Vogesella sp.]|uniref:GGDEF domain-containing protein n=1 Tax=Vogesella sp. TaxID=1904252 RepID=UPI003F3D4D26